jgi:hypothetical protein
VQHRSVFWALTVLVVVVLVGCQQAESTAAPEVAGPAGPGAGPGAGLALSDGLALGTLKLEGTEGAVTPAQASELLPLWKMIQGGSLQGDAESQAVLKQIQAKMTESQLAAIRAMGLTWQDLGAWMQQQGIEMPTRPSGQGGGAGAFGNLSDEERAKLRQEFQDMSPEQRATRMAEMGIQRPQGAPEGQESSPGAWPDRGGLRQSSVLLEPLIALLTARAAQ